MEIYIARGESLTIFATSCDGEKKTFTVSHLEMMKRGLTLVGGLTTNEIDALQRRKKILAIKLYRERTLEPLSDCKRLVEEWVGRNQCCNEWPNCKHLTCIAFLNDNLLMLKKEQLALHWTFPEALNVEQCHALMTLRGYSATTFGFFSFLVEDGITSWSSNANPNNNNNNNTEDSDTESQ